MNIYQMNQDYNQVTLRDERGITIGLVGETVKKILDQTSEVVSPEQFEYCLKGNILLAFGAPMD